MLFPKWLRFLTRICVCMCVCLVMEVASTALIGGPMNIRQSDRGKHKLGVLFSIISHGAFFATRLPMDKLYFRRWLTQIYPADVLKGMLRPYQALLVNPSAYSIHSRHPLPNLLPRCCTPAPLLLEPEYHCQTARCSVLRGRCHRGAQLRRRQHRCRPLRRVRTNSSRRVLSLLQRFLIPPLPAVFCTGRLRSAQPRGMATIQANNRP